MARKKDFFPTLLHTGFRNVYVTSSSAIKIVIGACNEGKLVDCTSA